MPVYVYECLDCASKFDLDAIDTETYESEVLYEAKHSINPTDSELESACVCPRCKGSKRKQVYYGYNVAGYVKGDGFLDVRGAKRDMHQYNLTVNDPYGQYRVAGEVDDLKNKFKKMGQHNPNSKHFVPKITEQDVKKVVDNNKPIHKVD